MAIFKKRSIENRPFLANYDVMFATYADEIAIIGISYYNFLIKEREGNFL